MVKSLDELPLQTFIIIDLLASLPDMLMYQNFKALPE